GGVSAPGSLQGRGDDLCDGPCIRRELYDQNEHGWFVKIADQARLDSGTIQKQRLNTISSRLRLLNPTGIRVETVVNGPRPSPFRPRNPPPAGPPVPRPRSSAPGPRPAGSRRSLRRPRTPVRRG